MFYTFNKTCPTFPSIAFLAIFLKQNIDNLNYVLAFFPSKAFSNGFLVVSTFKQSKSFAFLIGLYLQLI
jgi:hypothetical protein